MGQPGSALSLVRSSYDVGYVVLDAVGKIGRAYRANERTEAALENVIGDMAEGQYNHPRRVVGFNASEGWLRDVSEHVAREVLKRLRGKALPSSTREFLNLHIGENEVVYLTQRRPS